MAESDQHHRHYIKERTCTANLNHLDPMISAEQQKEEEEDGFVVVNSATVTESVPGPNARKKGIPVNKDEDDDDVSKYKEEEERETFLLLDCDKAIRPTVAMNDTVMHDQSDTEDKVFFGGFLLLGRETAEIGKQDLNQGSDDAEDAVGGKRDLNQEISDDEDESNEDWTKRSNG